MILSENFFIGKILEGSIAKCIYFMANFFSVFLFLQAEILVNRSLKRSTGSFDKEFIADLQRRSRRQLGIIIGIFSLFHVRR